ncbi:MAG: hypothetical protein KF901_03695 [Myxococcales bacterium]|nr:hypothetical protein [Myxococcales bacterium]
MRRTMLLATMLLATFACGGDDDDGSGDAGGGRTDAGRDGGSVQPRPCRVGLPVDLVFVIDNSHSMQEEQVSLAENFPVLIEMLTQPPDSDDDGTPDFPPVTDLRIGILTTDLGVGPHTSIPSCSTATGDDGVFVHEARATEGPCAGYAIEGGRRWLELDPESPATISEGFACLAQLGTDGCGLEQQLESSFVAITRQMGAGQPNEGFFRPNSLIAFVFVTDEDDCSALDVETFFDPSFDARERFGPLGTRCAFHPGELHPIHRYVQAFKNLALDRDGDVIVAGIVGVPRSFTTDPTDVDYDAVLSDPAMAYRPSDPNPNQLAPACSFGGVGEAHPARRIVEVIREFDETGSGLLASICQPDLRPAIASIAEIVGARLCVGPD